MPNRLAAEQSPYLRQHADNPVDWQPWGTEALEKARAEQKPVFLSIGYSTCHWCHVMAHESFENPAVAAVLNAGFVPVKVDREERPDLDRIYMTYVQRTTGHGGWPMSVWLTPEGKPFFGGTYFPPDDRHGRPGFVTVLNAITRHWQEQREKILAGADEVVAALQAPAEFTPEVSPLHEAAGEAFEKGYQYFADAYDAAWGGFGGAPKFPRASVINFLLRIAALQGIDSEDEARAAGMAAHTLQRMAEGGLHDHVGGGFHRYAVDEEWFVPHFEKMLYDQAQIALNYLEMKQATGREVFAWLARDILAYVRRDLTAPAGGFYSAEDADSPPPAASADGERRMDEGEGKGEQAEGAFYVWTRTEIDALLGIDAEFFCAHYGVKPAGNVDHDPQGEFAGKNILRQRQSLAVTAREFGREIGSASAAMVDSLEKLRVARARRPRPSRDDKVITAWNGLMISALARARQVLGAPSGEEADHLAAATRAATFIERELYDPASGVLYRSWREGRGHTPGFAEDYAFLIQGLLDLYEAGFDIHWLQWAADLQGKMTAGFWDSKAGGYFNSRAGDATVIMRLKEDYDGAEPAPNSVAALNLVRLDWMLGEGGGPSTYRDQALLILGAFRRQWSRAPHALPQMLCALEMALAEPRTVVIAGDPRSADFHALAAILHEGPGPRRALLCADGGPGQEWLASARPYLAAMKAVRGRAAAYVCENFACQQPVTEAGDLRRLLSGGSRT